MRRAQSSPRAQATPDGSPALDDFLTYRLNALALLLNADAARLAGRHGLRLPEWRALANLAVHGPFAPGWLAAQHQMDKGLASRALAGLTARGLAELRPDPGDGRRLVAVITPKGRRVHAAALPDALARQARLRALLPKEDMAALERAVACLTAGLREDELARPDKSRRATRSDEQRKL